MAQGNDRLDSEKLLELALFRLAVNSVVVGSPPPRPGLVTFSFISSPLTVPSYLVIDSPRWVVRFTSKET